MLTDSALMTLFKGAASALAPDGIIFVKENICDACEKGFDIETVRALQVWSGEKAALGNLAK